jgi:hypothetical protein
MIARSRVLSLSQCVVVSGGRGLDTERSTAFLISGFRANSRPILTNQNRG